MTIPGNRVKRKRFVHSAKYVIVVEVEMVIPADDPSEACYEPETVKFLKEVQEHIDQDDVAWLAKHGKVYAALEAA